MSHPADMSAARRRPDATPPADLHASRMLDPTGQNIGRLADVSPAAQPHAGTVIPSTDWRSGMATHQTPPAIEVDGLVKTYGALPAVDEVSFTVGQGEFFGILGPNGAGKTTTLELIEGLREPDAGQICLLGESPWPRNPRLLPRIGVQLQAGAFFDKLGAREQLETFAAPYGVPPSRVTELLKL